MEYDGVLMLSAGSGYGPFDTVNLELRRHRKVKCLPARQKAEGPRRKLVGLLIDSPATARHGFEVLDLEGAAIGYVTTGYNSLTLGQNIAMALIDARYAPLGSKLQVRIRRKTAPATVVKKRFYIPNYKK